MDRIIKNYEEPLMKPMSLKESIKHMKHKRFVKKMNKLQKKMGMGQSTCGHDHSNDAVHENTPPKDIKIVSLALVVDDIVVDVLNTQESFANMLQRNPKFILLNKKDERPTPGWAYKDDKFMPFDKIISDASPTKRG